ncbi:MAG: ATP-binding protein [Planctomycetes bacterium]|nr:ATP-binding protein [Planctomycetota bacterium]
MSSSLKPWYAVAIPHEDIRKGRLEEAVFAANLWAVVQGTAPEVYLDPKEFYRKTFMTAGLGTVLKRVAGALSGDGESGDRIISLQTPFGGGKTHTLVALWHLAKHTDKLRKSSAGEGLCSLLADRFPGRVKGVAVFTNATCDATQGRKTPEGIHTRTLWGELAVQLGGQALYERVRANDEAQRVPQGLFEQVLKDAAPCLILLDELADYCVGAAAVPVGSTTLADQTVSFIQQLTEAVGQVPGVALVGTLPASKYEVTQSETGQAIFSTLEKRFERYAADILPAAGHEIASVVRARLFDRVTPEDDPDYPAKVAEAYQEMCAAHAGEVPADTARRNYREEVEQSFPFHPLLLETLYTRWGSHPDFQRTRGVLRLLASIVGDLWQRREGNTQTQHLIQPCHVRWSIDAMQSAMTRLWGAGYQAVVAADVVAGKSNAADFDEERGGDYQREAIGQGLASSILLGSFGGKAERSGFSSKELKLACCRYGLNWNYLDGALLELENRCFHLHSTTAGSLGRRYWFGTKPSLNKLLVQYRQQVASKSFDADILEALKTQSQPSGGLTDVSWQVKINPESDLPEQKALTLLILPPSVAWSDSESNKEEVLKLVLALSLRCGTKDRTFRNTLVFLCGTSRGLNKLRQTHRERAALEGIRSDYGDKLDEEQKADLKGRIETARRAALEALGPAYTVALRVHGQNAQDHSLPDAGTAFADHLASAWRALVEDEEWILRRVGAITLQQTGLVLKEGGLRIQDAVEAFLRLTDKPMIASRRAVTDGLAQACKDGLIGIGRGGSPTSLHARYCKQAISLDPAEDGVWIIPASEPEATKPSPAPSPGAVTPGAGATTPSASRAATGVADGSMGGQGGDTPPPPAPTVRRFAVRGSVPVENYGELFRCFVGPAARMDLKKFRIDVGFEMEAQETRSLDPNDPRLKAMKEAAHQLGLMFDAT